MLSSEINLKIRAFFLDSVVTSDQWIIGYSQFWAIDYPKNYYIRPRLKIRKSWSNAWSNASILAFESLGNFKQTIRKIERNNGRLDHKRPLWGKW